MLNVADYGLEGLLYLNEHIAIYEGKIYVDQFKPYSPQKIDELAKSHNIDVTGWEIIYV